MTTDDINSVIDVVEIERIKEMIPHRYPFLMIDRVLDLTPGKKATGIKNVSINEPYFQGHFPDYPIMPGVMVIEAMAQTAAVVVVSTLESGTAGQLVYFMSVDSARFRKPITPGDNLRIYVEKVRSRGNVWKFKGLAKVDDTLMAEAVFTAMIVGD